MLPQLGAMYRGDRARKTTLVEFGFRLPSALDNRPLRFEEFDQLVHQYIYVSATPADYEKRVSGGEIAERLELRGFDNGHFEVPFSVGGTRTDAHNR